MGCSSSKKTMPVSTEYGGRTAEDGFTPARRRLSTMADPKEEAKRSAGQSSSRPAKSGKPGRRRNSIEPDVGADRSRRDGAQKAGGAKMRKLPIRYGTRSRPGNDPMKRKKENQDCFIVQDCFGDHEDQLMVGVFDGHGPNGAIASNFIRDVLQFHWLDAIGHDGDLRKVWDTEGKRDLGKATRDGFLVANQKLALGDKDMHVSGTTAVTMLVCGNRALVANVGDSRIVMGKQSGTRFVATDMSRDHKPDLPQEEKRILGAGGRVFEWGVPRVWLKDVDMPGLAVSRSFGDMAAESVGVFADPETGRFTFGSSAKFIILASDGVWEFISSQEAVDIVAPFFGDGGDRSDPQAACDALVEESLRRWRQEENVVDDTTAVVLMLNYSKPT